jgi:hypothetical protein
MGDLADSVAGAGGGACAPNSAAATTQQHPPMTASAPSRARTVRERRLDVYSSSSLKDRITALRPAGILITFRTNKVYTFQFADTTAVSIGAVLLPMIGSGSAALNCRKRYTKEFWDTANYSGRRRDSGLSGPDERIAEVGS